MLVYVMREQVGLSHEGTSWFRSHEGTNWFKSHEGTCQFIS